MSVPLTANGLLTQPAGGEKITTLYILDRKCKLFVDWTHFEGNGLMFWLEKNAGGSCGAQHNNFKEKNSFSQHGAWVYGPDKPEG